MEKSEQLELFTEGNFTPDPSFEVSEVELIYKRKVDLARMPSVQDSKSAYELLRKNWDDNKIDMCEEFKAIYLNQANKVTAIYNAFVGGITGTVADPRMIIACALKCNAVSIIIAHNHPSGGLNPSRQDEALTQKIKEGGAFLDIKLLDHLILTREGYTSFADLGIL